MKTGEAAQRLGITAKTIRVWCDIPELALYLTPAARGIDRAQRVLNDDDVRVMATVYFLRYRDGLTEWSEIAEHLETGRRNELPNLDGVTAHTETVSRPYAEQSAKAAATLAERDAAFAEVSALRGEIDRLRSEYDDKIADLQQEIRRLERELGRAEGRLDAMRDDD